MPKSFEAALRRELELILQDPAFARSPVQSKLLHYLGEQTLAGPNDISQYAIAVDGLDRPEDYDMVTDSYPRVQISRLRKNLVNYYSRNEPADEGCLFLRSGNYRLHLASRDVAYPKAKPFAAPEEDGHAEDLIGEPSSYGGLHASGVSDAIRSNTPARTPARRFAGWRRSAIAGAGAIAAAAFGFLLSAQYAGADAPTGPPLIALNLTVGDILEDLAGSEEVAESADRMARIQLANSFVSRLAPRGSESSAQYTLTINIGNDIGGSPEAYIALKDIENRVLYSDTAHHGGDTTAFLAEIEANIIYLTSPTGLIAKNEIKSVPKRPASDFHCFLTVEALRSEGKQIDGLVDECLTRFPDSAYASSWLARQGFAAYQQRIIAGKSIDRDGPGWAALQASLQSNRDNAFANLIAGKVELVLGNCVRAHNYIDRAVERGTTYPALVASAIAEGSNCSENDHIRTDYREYLVSLATSNPDPDPLLHLYLTLAALSLDRPDIAKQLADSSKITAPTGSVEIVSQFLRKRLLNEQFSKAEMQKFERNLPLFVWNKPARDEMLRKLETASAAAQL